MPRFYYSTDGLKTEGPVSGLSINQVVQEYHLGTGAFVMQEGDPTWTLVEDLGKLDHISLPETLPPELKKFLTLAKVAAEGGNKEEAYQYYTRALEIDYTNMEAYIGKGVVSAFLSTVDKPRLNETVSYFGMLITLKAGTGEELREFSKILFNVVTTVSKRLLRELLAAEAIGCDDDEDLMKWKRIRQGRTETIRYKSTYLAGYNHLRPGATEIIHSWEKAVSLALGLNVDSPALIWTEAFDSLKLDDPEPFFYFQYNPWDYLAGLIPRESQQRLGIGVSAVSIPTENVWESKTNDEEERNLTFLALRVIHGQRRKASAGQLQWSLDINYHRAIWLIDRFVDMGIIESGDGPQPRRVLIDIPLFIRGGIWLSSGDKELIRRSIECIQRNNRCTKKELREYLDPGDFSRFVRSEQYLNATFEENERSYSYQSGTFSILSADRNRIQFVVSYLELIGVLGRVDHLNTESIEVLVDLKTYRLPFSDHVQNVASIPASTNSLATGEANVPSLPSTPSTETHFTSKQLLSLACCSVMCCGPLIAVPVIALTHRERARGNRNYQTFSALVIAYLATITYVALAILLALDPK